jgi:hypothetical protein
LEDLSLAAHRQSLPKIAGATTGRHGAPNGMKPPDNVADLA